MGKLKELHAQGVTDLGSYLIGVENERDRILNALRRESEQCLVADGTDFECEMHELHYGLEIATRIAHDTWSRDE